MWNFGIPSSLKAWIDHVVRAGKTFNYVGGAVDGLAKGKKAILVLASGGIFSEGALEIMGFRGAVSAPDSGLHWNWMTSRPYGPGMNIPPLAIHEVSNGEKAVEALVIQKERTMLDHIILTVSNVERSLAFYEAALKPLHIKFFLPYKGEGDHPDLWGFGDGKRAFFWIKQGKPDPASVHWGFMAENNGKVDEFYRAAISAGARDNISPRARVEYYPGYYAADVFDPDGYSFEVVHKS